MGIRLEIIVSYELLGKLQYLFAQKNWHIENIEYTEKIKVSIFCQLDMLETVEGVINEVSSGKVTFQKDEERIYFKKDNRLFL